MRNTVGDRVCVGGGLIVRVAVMASVEVWEGEGRLRDDVGAVREVVASIEMVSETVTVGVVVRVVVRDLALFVAVLAAVVDPESVLTTLFDEVSADRLEVKVILNE